MKRLFHFLHRSSISRGLALALWLLPCVAFSVMSVSPGTVSAEDWEWDPSSGYHQEEWYDPSDWFNEDTVVDYEDDYYGDYYDDDYDEDYEDGYAEDGYEAGYSDDDYEDDYYDDGYYYYDGYDYYSEDWYDDEPDFDDWYGYILSDVHSV